MVYSTYGSKTLRENSKVHVVVHQFFSIFLWSSIYNHDLQMDPFRLHKKLIKYIVFLDLPSFKSIPVSSLLSRLFPLINQTVPDTYWVFPSGQFSNLNFFRFTYLRKTSACFKPAEASNSLLKLFLSQLYRIPEVIYDLGVILYYLFNFFAIKI